MKKGRRKGEMLSVIAPYLPSAVYEEIRAVARSQARFTERLAEVRLRTPGACSLTLDGGNVPLRVALSAEDLRGAVGRLCHGSLYAYRDCLANGYLPLSHGIRVGVAGTARYEGGALVGIDEVSSLSFRLPTRASENLAGLLDAFSRTRAGMLIYAPPGEGKTSALRALGRALGSGAHPRRVAIVDARFEFVPETFAGTTVDLLRGYAPALGLEIAVRTLSPEVLLMDEIGGEAEARAALDVLKTVADNEEADETARADAAEKISKIAVNIQNEANIETLVKAKGYEECVAVIGDDSVSVIVRADSLQAAQAAEIFTIAYETTGISPEKISIMTK